MANRVSKCHLRYYWNIAASFCSILLFKSHLSFWKIWSSLPRIIKLIWICTYVIRSEHYQWCWKMASQLFQNMYVIVHPDTDGQFEYALRAYSDQQMRKISHRRNVFFGIWNHVQKRLFALCHLQHDNWTTRFKEKECRCSIVYRPPCFNLAPAHLFQLSCCCEWDPPLT